MKRSNIDLHEIADWQNLARAYYLAAKGCGNSRAVQHFGKNLDANLALMQQQVLDGTLSLGIMRSFYIRDPKLRLIHAPSFRERVLHHALISPIGPILDRALIDDTYACRKGKGTLMAVKRCQQHIQRFKYYVQIDIRHFFSSIDQQILLALLQKKFKNPALLRLMAQIISAFQSEKGLGLPIGSLTSQHFANFYLAGLDRFLLENLKVRGMVRYMDDIFWCCNSKEQAWEQLQKVQTFLSETLHLIIKHNPTVAPCRNGAVFCGFRVLSGQLLLSRRRKRRYIVRRRYWESQYQQGKIDALKLQSGYSAALAITAHTDSTAWRREELYRHPLENSLLEV